ncbi:hypothetical protein DXK93_01520 [Achromobacter sp. K91]|uniref:hypothetical protein n=1 Tax=Achromobacter sp. K91 TaxID=2292262 RepID=UPI000E664A7E|nr:hypothetical protein [Achromobacter sp. K91]RIJ06033.1 hypothetical protein DXK93_01520 [Achromobacter sp. K91]
MHTATQQPDHVGPMQRLNTLAAEALTQYHAEISAGGEPVYPAWVDDLAAVADALNRAEVERLDRMPSGRQRKGAQS